MQNPHTEDHQKYMRGLLRSSESRLQMDGLALKLHHCTIIRRVLNVSYRGTPQGAGETSVKLNRYYNQLRQSSCALVNVRWGIQRACHASQPFRRVAVWFAD
eukprot:596245-Amphidinium_carterae.3